MEKSLFIAYSSISALNATFWIIQDADLLSKRVWTRSSFTSRAPARWHRPRSPAKSFISPANGQVIVDVGVAGRRSRRHGGVTNVVAFYIMVDAGN